MIPKEIKFRIKFGVDFGDPNGKIFWTGYVKTLGQINKIVLPYRRAKVRCLYFVEELKENESE